MQSQELFISKSTKEGYVSVPLHRSSVPDVAARTVFINQDAPPHHGPLSPFALVTRPCSKDVNSFSMAPPQSPPPCVLVTVEQLDLRVSQFVII